MKELMSKALPDITKDIARALGAKEITQTPFESKNEILKNEVLQQEVGYQKMPDGSYLVSMTCPLPGITPDMIAWWFWWHPSKKERYQVWFPGEHFSIAYPSKQSDYFEQETCPAFQNNTQYPDERIGGVMMPLRIDFVTPEEFGFSKAVMEDNRIPLIVCGHVGVFKGILWHTEMAHIFKESDDGLFLISRFWLGKTMYPLLRKMLITEKLAKGMAEHCCVEYRNLWEILPQLYRENNKNHS